MAAEVLSITSCNHEGKAKGISGTLNNSLEVTELLDQNPFLGLSLDEIVTFPTV